MLKNEVNARSRSLADCNKVGRANLQVISSATGVSSLHRESMWSTLTPELRERDVQSLWGAPAPAPFPQRPNGLSHSTCQTWRRTLRVSRGHAPDPAAFPNLSCICNVTGCRSFGTRSLISWQAKPSCSFRSAEETRKRDTCRGCLSSPGVTTSFSAILGGAADKKETVPLSRCKLLRRWQFPSLTPSVRRTRDLKKGNSTRRR
jgi:hypothetical protein